MLPEQMNEGVCALRCDLGQGPFPWALVFSLEGLEHMDKLF